MEKELKSAEEHIIEQNREIVDYLKDSRLFSPFPRKYIEKLVPLSELVEIPKGEIILKEGERNTKVYFLLRGEISLYSGGQHILNLRRKGDIFGERSIIRDQSGLHTVIAETPVRVFFIKSQDIGNIKGISHDEFHNFLYRLFAVIMTDKLSLTNSKAEKYEITQKELLKEIADHQHSKENLIKSEKKYRSLIERAPEPIVVIKDEKIVYANPEVVRSIGYSENELFEMSYFELIAASDLVESKNRFENRKKGIADPYFEIQLVTKSEEIRSAEATAVKIEWEGDPAFLYFLSDITDRKQAEEALIKSEQMKNAMISNISDVIGILSADGITMYKSPNIKKYFGWDPDDLVGNSAFATVHPDDLEKIQKIFKEILQNTSPIVTVEFNYICKNGNSLPVELIANNQLDNPNINGILINYRDISERKQAEQQIKASLIEKETLLKEIHHRVKNNMNVVSGLLSLHKNSTQHEEVKKALQESQGRVYAMSAVHESLYNSKSLAEIDLIGYLKKLSTSLIQTYSVNPSKVRLIVEGDDVKVGINKASPLGLSVNELISNALKYAFPDDRKGKIEVTLQKQDDRLALTIQDDGVGMPEGFDWKNSSSLGLKLVRNLIENQLNGSIDANTQDGTQFTITISLDA